jgi:hypothetical protein
VTPAEARQWIEAASLAIHGWQRYDPHDWDIDVIWQLLRRGDAARAIGHADEVRRRCRSRPLSFLRLQRCGQRRVMVFARRLIREFF